MMQKHLSRRFRLVSLLLASIALSGCDTLGYYGQAARGQIALLAAREPVSKLIADASTEASLRVQLEKSQEILAFAAAAGMPVEKSYSEYVDLGRPYVVWNVFAAQTDSIQLKTQCFPIAGCVGYKGYFQEAAAQAYADELAAQGLDVFVGGITAYSTLGWFDDPLLNTFIFRPDERLAGVLFHELAHKVVYLEGDTVFNESFATAVEQHLLKRWLKDQGKDQLYDAYIHSGQRRDAVIDLILNTRQELAAIYRAGLSKDELLNQKAEKIAEMRTRYEALKANWAGGNEFAGWMAQDLNNAQLAAIGAYQSQVPGFAAMIERLGLAQFFIAAEQLSQLDKAERDQRLAEH